MRIPANQTTTPPTLDYYIEARDRFSGDVATDLAVMLLDYVRESRQLDQERTRSETAHLRLVQAAQVEDLREEADKLREAGMARGVGLIASGLFSVGSGLATASTTTTGTTDASAPGAASQEPGTDWSKVLAGGAAAANGGGEFWAAYADRQAALARTRATEHEHQAGESERRLETLDEARSHSEKLERSVFEHLRSVHETRAAINRASTTWRG